jgi:uncharacterized membrane protein YbhN (UPF0104 family)
VAPGRLGDFVVRPFLIGRTEGLSKTATFATIVVERIFDLLIVLLLFGVYVSFGPPPARGAIDLAPARTAGGLLLAASLGAVACLIWLSSRGALARAWIGKCSRFFPGRFRVRLVAMSEAFVEGLSLFKDRANALASVAWGLLTWFAIGLSMLFGCRAFGLDQVTFMGTFLLMGLGAVGVAIPVPGGIGTFHNLVYEGLRLLGCAQGATSQAAVLLIHAAAVIPISTLGLYYWLRYSILHVKLTELEKEDAR